MSFIKFRTLDSSRRQRSKVKNSISLKVYRLCLLQCGYTTKHTNMRHSNILRSILRFVFLHLKFLFSNSTRFCTGCIAYKFSKIKISRFIFGANLERNLVRLTHVFDIVATGTCSAESIVYIT